jgi:hypothetical protein
MMKEEVPHGYVPVSALPRYYELAENKGAEFNYDILQ